MEKAFQERENCPVPNDAAPSTGPEVLTHLEQKASPYTSVSHQGHCVAPPGFEHLHPFFSFANGILIFPKTQVSNMSGPSKHVYYNTLSPPLQTWARSSQFSRDSVWVNTVSLLFAVAGCIIVWSYRQTTIFSWLMERHV